MNDNSSLTEITEDLKDAGTHLVKAGAGVLRAGRKVGRKVISEAASFLTNSLLVESESDSEIEDELTEALSKPGADVFNLNDCVVVGTPENFRALKKNLLPRVKLPPELLDDLTQKIIQGIKENLNDLSGGTLSEQEEQEIRKVILEYFD